MNIYFCRVLTLIMNGAIVLSCCSLIVFNHSSFFPFFEDVEGTGDSRFKVPTPLIWEEVVATTVIQIIRSRPEEKETVTLSE